MLRTKALVLATALVAGIGAETASAAPESCEEWNTIAFFIRAEATDIARCLKTKDANARDAVGLTPMHRAAGFGGTPALVRTLAKAGAQTNTRDVNGMTPLHLAVHFNKKPDMVAALIKAGAKANARDDYGRSPLHLAAQGDTPGVVRALVKGGAEVDARDKRGAWTPLHLAAWFGKSPAVVKALIKAGANLRLKDKSGRTPLDYAEVNETLNESVSLLKREEVNGTPGRQTSSNTRKSTTND